MSRQIRARFSKGKIEPLEQLELQEGEEMIISVEEVPVPEKKPEFGANLLPPMIPYGTW
jgi:predicted DNA-binding antitoxin AbrB/MazE fold protein